MWEASPSPVYGARLLSGLRAQPSRGFKSRRLRHYDRGRFADCRSPPLIFVDEFIVVAGDEGGEFSGGGQSGDQYRHYDGQPLRRLQEHAARASSMSPLPFASDEGGESGGGPSEWR